MALRGELEGLSYILNAFVVQSWFGTEIPRERVGEVRRFFEEAKGWGDDIGDASRISAKSDDELLGLLKGMAKYERTVATGIPTPVLDHVIANPPQTWGIELRRKFSDLRWHVYLLDSDAERMNQNYQITFTVPKICPIGDPMADRAQALFASHQSIVQSYTKRADILLQKVHAVIDELQ